MMEDCMTPFLHKVAIELMHARSQHAKQNSLHEGYAVLLEEVEEFWIEVKKRSSERDPQLLLSELIQIAAMAARCAEDCGLIEPTYDTPMRLEYPGW